jgi:hypothetical protein
VIKASLGVTNRSRRKLWSFCFDDFAITCAATHIVAFDKDFLTLMTALTDDARRFRRRLPSIRVVMPGDLLNDHPELHSAH